MQRCPGKFLSAFLFAFSAELRVGCPSLLKQDFSILRRSSSVEFIQIFIPFWATCRKLLFLSTQRGQTFVSGLRVSPHSLQVAISCLSFSCVHFAAGELDAFDFFGEEVLRLGGCVHRVTVQKTVYMSARGCAVVFARFIIL